MMLKAWEALPDSMRFPEVRPYYEILRRRQLSLLVRRVFDFAAALLLLILLALPMLAIAVWIKCDSPGPVFYRQERVTRYGKHFRIHKFRTMVDRSDQLGSAVTVDNDSRITRVGARLRRLRLDELPQLFNILKGEMSFDEINKKWAKKPTLKLLWQKYVWGNRQKIFFWNLKNKLKINKA